MRKYRNIERDEMIRLCKTPSPSTYSDFKSPRFIKSNHNIVDLKTKSNNEELKYQSRKAKDADVLKIYVVQAKQRESIARNQGQEQKSKKLLKPSRDRKLKKVNDTRNVTEPPDIYDPYCFLPQNSAMNKEKVKQKEGQNSCSSRKSSINGEDRESISQGKAKFKQTIHKLINQNITLRHEIKSFHQKYEKLLMENNDLCEENNKIMAEFKNLSQNKQQAELKEAELNLQIRNLKRLLNINSQELSQSNYEIYKMKQQLYQLHLSKQKFETNTNKISTPKHSLNESRNTVIGSSKFITTETTIQQRNSICQNCSKNCQSIMELTSRNENLRFQLSQKQAIIHSLCSQIQRIDNELKMFQKPKLIFKKLSSIINQMNNEIVLSKAKELSSKYLKK